MKCVNTGLYHMKGRGFAWVWIVGVDTYIAGGEPLENKKRQQSLQNWCKWGRGGVGGTLALLACTQVQFVFQWKLISNVQNFKWDFSFFVLVHGDNQTTFSVERKICIPRKRLILDPMLMPALKQN